MYTYRDQKLQELEQKQEKLLCETPELQRKRKQQSETLKMIELIGIEEKLNILDSYMQKIGEFEKFCFRELEIESDIHNNIIKLEKEIFETVDSKIININLENKAGLKDLYDSVFLKKYKKEFKPKYENAIEEVSVGPSQARERSNTCGF